MVTVGDVRVINQLWRRYDVIIYVSGELQAKLSGEEWIDVWIY